MASATCPLLGERSLAASRRPKSSKSARARRRAPKFITFRPTSPPGALAHEQRLRRLHEVATAALARYDLPPGATATMINLSENATFRIDAPSGQKWAMRVHREGYHSKNGIASELAWIQALRKES